MKIGLVSDVHLRSENRESVVEELSGVVDHFNDSFDPDATVVLGDIIEHAETAGQDAETTDWDVKAAEQHEQNVREIDEQNVRAVDKQNVRAVTETLADLDSPVTYLAGNHDVMNLTSDELADLLDQELWGRIDAIDSIDGSDGSDDTDGIDGIDALYLDSSAPHLPGARGEVSDEQLAFLDGELGRMDSPGRTDNSGETDNSDRADNSGGTDNSDGTNTSDRTDSSGRTAGRLLFVHHPIHYHDVRDNYWFGETPERAFCGNKKKVNRILEAQDDVLAVFNGHLHETDYTRYRGVHHFTVNAFSKERPDSGITGTYAEVTLDDRLTVRVVEGDRVTRTFEVPV